MGQQCGWAQRGSAPTGLFWDHVPGRGHRAERVVAGRSRGPWLESWPHPPGGWCTCLHVAASALPGRPAKGQQGLPRPSPRVPATAFCQPDQVARPAQAPGVGRQPPALMRTGGHFNVLYSRGCWPLLPQPHPRFLPVLFTSQVNTEHWGPPLSTASTRSRSCHGPSLAPGCSPGSCITYPSVAQAG